MKQRKPERRVRERRHVIEPSWRAIVKIFIRVLEEKDPYTRGHSERVERYVGLLAKALKWDAYRTECACIAALLHDIGKVVVERSTLTNQLTNLTAEQRDQLFDHPYTGACMVRGLFPLEVTLGVLQHHERIDGRVDGVAYAAYPFGVAGDQIHPIARAIAICDTYDAMTTKRSYNHPISPAEAMALLRRDAGIRHDQEMVEVFCTTVVPEISKIPS